MKNPSKITATYDHAVLCVRDLDQAVSLFDTLGFTSTRGGEFKDSNLVHNALIGFKDNTCLELVGFQKRSTAHLINLTNKIGIFSLLAKSQPKCLLDRFIVPMSQPKLSTDLCVRVSNLDAVEQLIKTIGTAKVERIKMERVRPDGERVKWELLFSNDTPLPFFINDITPVKLRVPQDQSHKNNTQSVVAVEMLCADISYAHKCYSACFGSTACILTPDVLTIKMKGCMLHLRKDTRVKARFHVDSIHFASSNKKSRIEEHTVYNSKLFLNANT